MKPKVLRGGVGHTPPQGVFTPLLPLCSKLPPGYEKPRGDQLPAEKTLTKAKKMALAKEMIAHFDNDGDDAA